MRAGIVICTRLNSTRVKEKPLRIINGKPVIVHLVNRLKKTGLPITLACDTVETQSRYVEVLDAHGLKNDVSMIACEPNDPMLRMLAACGTFQYDIAIRVCHDKIFVDDREVLRALDKFRKYSLEYVVGDNFIAGSSFEVIHADALKRACSEFKNVEHVSYAIRAVTKRVETFETGHKNNDGVRLLIDYPEDVQMLRALFSKYGDELSLREAASALKRDSWLMDINRLPKVTVYTCVYNGEKYIEECVESVDKQRLFYDVEYIIVDDASKDKTNYLINRFASDKPYVKVITNEENLGLSSSSNEALKHARGEYIVRLDADDFFCLSTSLNDLFLAIECQKKEAIYPNNYFGSLDKVQHGSECHHIGGAIFKTSAINHIKFTDKLRGYEGYDFFNRAKDQLNMGYLNSPVFFYRQHGESLTKEDTNKREAIKKEIDQRLGLCEKL